jgi:hypothetical protein
MAKIVHDLTGQRFHRLLVLGRVYYDGPSRGPRWHCLCDCGNHREVATGTLKRGNTKSCGCWNKDRHTKHGLRYTYFYSTFDQARQRCRNPRHDAYKWYGARGIEFRFTSLAQFAAELGERPTPKHTLDRTNNDGHYEPGNVRWATASEQLLNQRKRTPAQLEHLVKARKAKRIKSQGESR